MSIAAIPTIDCSQTVNEIVSRHPETLAVFTAWGIDTCCGGGHPVEAVVQRHQLDGEALCNALVLAINGGR
jgi:iron-sulfur cluster repair protein YtfE (RIC family)